MIVAGIDPGIRGGLAIIAVEDGAAPRGSSKQSGQRTC